MVFLLITKILISAKKSFKTPLNHPQFVPVFGRWFLPVFPANSAVGDGRRRRQQRRDAVPRGAGIEALRPPLRQRRLTRPLLLRAWLSCPSFRPRPPRAPDDARRRRLATFRLAGVAQRLHGRRFQHPGEGSCLPCWVLGFFYYSFNVQLML